MLGKESTLNKVSFVGVGNIANTVMNFTFLAVVARNLETDAFGRYAVLTALLLLVSRLIDFGTNSIFVSENIKSQDNSEIDLFYGQKILLFLVTIPAALIMLASFKLLTLQLFAIFFLGLVAYEFNFTLYAIFQREQNFPKLIFANTVPSLIKMTFAALIFFSLLRVNLTGAFLIFAGSVFADILLIPLLPRKYLLARPSFRGLKEKFKKTLSPGFSQIIYESWPTLNNGLTKLYNQFSDVGIFTIANKISSIFTLIAVSVFTVILPKNSVRVRQKLLFDLKEAVVFVGGLIALSVVAVLVSRIFVTKFFGVKFEASLPLLNLLILSSAFGAAQGILESFFFAESQTGFLIKTSLVKLAMLTICALALIPKLGLPGLAVSNLVAAILGLLLTFYFINKARNTLQPVNLPKASF
jgi:O-antigen/teichoic acid export membrane protein